MAKHFVAEKVSEAQRKLNRWKSSPCAEEPDSGARAWKHRQGEKDREHHWGWDKHWDWEEERGQEAHGRHHWRKDVHRSIPSADVAEGSYTKALLSALLGTWHQVDQGADKEAGLAVAWHKVELAPDASKRCCASLRCTSWEEDSAQPSRRTVELKEGDIWLAQEARDQLYLDAMTDQRAFWVDKAHPHSTTTWRRGWPLREKESPRKEFQRDLLEPMDGNFDYIDENINNGAENWSPGMSTIFQ